MTTGIEGTAPTGVDPTKTSSQNGNSPNGTHPAKAGLLALSLGSVGVVYGDIGTSPLYAFREALSAGGHHLEAHSGDVIGIVSLILWTLFIIVTLKYVVFLLQADNDGEGGTLSLMALTQRALGRRSTVVFVLGVAGAALFYGDALITPAISVLSAVEGLSLITDKVDHLILPITIAIIVGLFLVQSRGTASMARWFGPITLVWFIVMAIGGLLHIADDPRISAAFNPYHGVSFLLHNGRSGLIALGAVFLAVTGAEALYADLGHFGKKPIRLAWLAVVFPALGLNYLGQGALVLSNPAAVENPFFLLYPQWALLPVVILATLATIIASQAVITGAYSLTRQAIQLRLLPRLAIRHTSAEHLGQIYMPQVNGMLLVGVIVLVLLFGSSSKLATAYGIAVTGTMVVTACLAFIVVWKHWRWPIWSAALMILPFIAIDLIFFGANALKLAEGGYIPMLFGLFIMLLMWTWVRGSDILSQKSRSGELPLRSLIENLARKPPQRVPGTAVFMTSEKDVTPTALMHSLKHYKVIHEKNVIVTIRSSTLPRIDASERIKFEEIDPHFATIVMTFGYMEEPNVPKALTLCRKIGFKFDIMSTSFFVSRRALRVASKSAMPIWQDRLFIWLAANATDATEYFHIPTGRTVEIGAQYAV
jgi:KUP system potassium uptake protein